MKTRIRVPETYVLIFFLIAISCLVTHIIPSGVYDLIPGTNMVDPETFHFVERNPAKIREFFECVL